MAGIRWRKGRPLGACPFAADPDTPGTDHPLLGWLPEVRADTVCLVRALPWARAASGFRFEPEGWGPGIFRLAAPGGSHLLVRRHATPEQAFWLPGGLAPRVGEPFGFYLHADVDHASRLRAAARIAHGIGRNITTRSTALRDAFRQVAMLYLYDAVQAGAACLSPRQFTRLFKAETGTTPARALETLRIEAAKLMLEQSRLPVEEIAREAGFGNRERMRRAFLRVHGEVPMSIRAAAGPVAAL